MKIAVTNDVGVERTLNLPSKKEVCGCCEGHGTILNPSIGEYAYSAEEFEEAFDDEEQEHYFKRGGMYDVTCPECHGTNVVDVLDESVFTSPAKKKLLARIHAAWQADAEFEHLCAMERRMGA